MYAFWIYVLSKNVGRNINYSKSSIEIQMRSMSQTSMFYKESLTTGIDHETSELYSILISTIQELMEGK